MQALFHRIRILTKVIGLYSLKLSLPKWLLLVQQHRHQPNLCIQRRTVFFNIQSRYARNFDLAELSSATKSERGSVGSQERQRWMNKLTGQTTAQKQLCKRFEWMIGIRLHVKNPGTFNHSRWPASWDRKSSYVFASCLVFSEISKKLTFHRGSRYKQDKRILRCEQRFNTVRRKVGRA